MLEIPQLCACGTDHPSKVIQAALISSGLVSVEKKNAAFYPIWLQSNVFLGLDWWKNDICPLINMHIFKHLSYISHVLCCQLSNIDIYLKQTTCKSCAIISIMSMQQKKNKTMKVCVTPQNKMCRQMHLCTYYNSLYFQGKCTYPSSQQYCCIFEL